MGRKLWAAGWLRQSSRLVTDNLGSSAALEPSQHSQRAVLSFGPQAQGTKTKICASQSLAVPGACHWGQGTGGGTAVLATSPLPALTSTPVLVPLTAETCLSDSIFTGVITAFQANIFLNVTRKLLIPYGKAPCIFAGQQTNCC